MACLLCYFLVKTDKQKTGTLIVLFIEMLFGTSEDLLKGRETGETEETGETVSALDKTLTLPVYSF